MDEEPRVPTVQHQVLGETPVIDDATMEDILDKLKLMDYENRFCRTSNGSFKPLTKTYFAIQSDKGTHQFFYFTSLCAWLMEEAGHSGFEAPGEFDDPNAASTNILQELRAMNIASRELAPNRIRQGHGDAVLTILSMLVDKALLKQNFTFADIVYPQGSTEVEEHGDDGMGMGGDDGIDDHIAIDSDEDEELFTGLGAARRAAGEEAEVITSQVAPEAWALEVERVGPLLQYRSDDTADWRARVDNASTLLKAVEKMYPDVKSMLERMGEDLAKTLDRIQKREQTLGQQFSEQVEDYRGKLQELNQVQDGFGAASKSVSSLSMELNGVSEALEQCKAQIQDREEKSSDISPLMKVKEAVTKVKSEIKEMSLRIGVLQHTVLHYTLRQRKAKLAGDQPQGIDVAADEYVAPL